MTEDDKIPKRVPPNPTHCDTPLTYVNIRKALLKPAPNQHINPKNSCRTSWINISKSFGLQTIHYWEMTKIQNFLLNTWRPECSSSTLSQMNQAYTLTKEIFNLHKNAHNQTWGLDEEILESKITWANKELHSKYLIRCFFEEAVLMSGSEAQKTGVWWKRVGSHIEYRSEEICMAASKDLWIVIHNQITYGASQSHLTLMGDLASQRYLIDLACNLAEENKIPGYPSPYTVNALFQSGDQMLEKKGNRAYDLIYTLEESCVSRFAGIIDPNNPVHLFRETVLKDWEAKADCLDLRYELRQRENLLDLAWAEDPNILSQLYGLYRIWGHPTLEPLEGVIATKRLAQRPRFYRADLSEEICNKMKEEFIIRWINKHKSWPSLNVSELSPFNVLRQAYENQAPYPIRDKRYRRGHLGLVKMEKVFPIDPKFDLIELIADKAISLGWDELVNNIRRHKNIGTSLSRSLLLKWMESDQSDPAVFLNEIDRHGFGNQEITVGVKEKEREGKLKARLFGLMTLIKRTYIVLTEKLLAEHLLPFFPEITMVDDELLLEKKRGAATNHKPKSVLYISLDFSKWNTNMRYWDTAPFFRMLDELFGFNNCFLRTHELFRNSSIYLLDGSYVPEIEGNTLKEDFGCWKNHLGGIEGLRQKGWTLWTISLILLVAEDFPFSLQLMGQGDNQMLVLRFHDGLSLREKIQISDDFINKLNDKLKQIGPPLKVAETWKSWDFFLYGKYPIWKGRPLMMSLKKICRMFRMSNEDYPLLESSLSSLAANLFSSIASDHQVDLSYWIYIYEVIGAFNNFLYHPYLQLSSPIYKTSKRDNVIMQLNEVQKIKRALPDIIQYSPLQKVELYHGLLLTPRSLGGYPIVLYASTLVKGFPDQLSYDIATLRHIYEIAPLHIKRLIDRIINPYLSRIPNYMLLFQNPEAINLDVNPSPLEARKGLMLDFLRSSPRVRNPYLKEFIDLLDSTQESELVQYLVKEERIYPKALIPFFKTTVVSRAMDVLAKVQKTPTLARVYLKEGAKDLYRRLERTELEHFKSILRMIFSGEARHTRWDITECSVRHATILRKIGWRKDVLGVDVCPPHEMFKIEIIDPHLPCYENPEWISHIGFIAIRLSNVSNIFEHLNRSYCDPFTLGSVPPYRGSVTKNKNESLGARLNTKTTSLLKRGLELASGAGWVYDKDGPLGDLARRLLAALTDLDFDILTPDLDQLSGSFEHRLISERIDHGGVVSVLANQATKIHLDTSNLVGLNKGGINKNFMFQSILSALVTVLGMHMTLKGDLLPQQVLHCHIVNICCLRDLEDKPITSSYPSETVPVYSNPDSPFLYVKASSLEEYLQVQQRFIVSPNISQDLDSVSDRFHSLLAYEVLQIIDPMGWISGHHKDRPLSSAISINWALVTDLPKLFTYVSVYLLGLFHQAHYSWESSILIDYAINLTISSPLNNWGYLYNLCFAPHFYSQLGQWLGSHIIPGGEVMTVESITILLKNVCIASLTSFKLNPLSCSQLFSFWASPSVPVGLHPTYMMHIYVEIMNQKTLCADFFENIKRLIKQMHIFHFYDDKLSRTRLHGEMIRSGITKDSLDALCKRVCPRNGDSYLPLHIKNIEIRRLPSVSRVWITIGDGMTIESVFNLKDIPDTDDFETFSQENRTMQGHQLRYLPLPTSACLKMMDLLRYLNPNDLRHSACLADGAGGFARVLIMTPCVDTVFYNTLVAQGSSVPQMRPIPFIPLVCNLPLGQQAKLEGLDITNDLCSDITDPAYPSIIQSWVREEFGTIVGDAESPSYYGVKATIKLGFAYLRCSIEWKARQGIFKFYYRNQKLLTIVIGILMMYYSETSIVRSKFSDPYSTEVYIICKHPTYKNTAIREDPAQQLISLRLPCPKIRNLLYEKCVRKHLSPHCPTSDIVTLYSEMISYDDVSDQLLMFLSTQFPWLHLDDDNKLSYEFPHSLQYWIGVGHTRSQRGFSLPARLSRTFFSPTEIKTWCLSWLFMYIYICNLQHIEYDLLNMIEVGYIIWYKQKNHLWSITASISPLPPIQLMECTVVYPFRDYLRTESAKFLEKCIGRAKKVNVRAIYDEPLTFSHFGQRDDSGNIISGTEPISQWEKGYVDGSSSDISMASRLIQQKRRVRIGGLNRDLTNKLKYVSDRLKRTTELMTYLGVPASDSSVSSIRES